MCTTEGQSPPKTTKNEGKHYVARRYDWSPEGRRQVHGRSLLGETYDEGSRYGIECGRISKATLKISGEVVYNYDRELDVPPQNEAAEMALAILMHEYN